MAENNPYSYSTWLEVQQSLSLRLNDTANVFWTIPEIKLYLEEALRFYNCLTQTWIQDVTFSYDQTSKAWQSTANSANSLAGHNPTSPRFQTLTDAYVYTMGQYHLLEPPTGNGTWTGTNQFSLDDFVQAFEGKRDTVLQETACNIGPIGSLSITPGTNRIQLPDSAAQTIMDLLRVRYLPDGGTPSTFWRDDGMAMEYFNNSYQQEYGTPFTWDVLASPPQFLLVDQLVSEPNTPDILGMLSGGTITPPTASPLLVPDDWNWVLKFGMMSDLLSKESESTDMLRYKYCEQRFTEGMKLMKEMPWLVQARINGVPCDTPSVAEADTFDNEWQSNPNAQIGIVCGGIDLFAVSPNIPASTTISVTLSLVGNAPIPASDGDFVQVGRDALDAILMEAHHLAAFKMGGKDFTDTIPLHQELIDMALSTNERLRMSGIFPTTIRPLVSREDEAAPRFAQENQQ